MPLLPVRSGWDPWSGDDPFYPDDLPPEWRLAYFANVCWAVAVPAARWRAAAVAGARDWARDTPSRFRFYLEAEPGLPSALAAPVAAVLGERFGGLIGHPLFDAEQACGLKPRPILGPRAGQGAGLSTTRGLAWTVPAPVIDDPRAARAWIERRVSASPVGLILALLGPCPGATVERWQTLVELMGC
ncbi:hypothetical protein [uncultured Lamprocystis sp.]|jgi:hypothetical protein|uniref:hypothetical protein n=1 Tax=uncultured Lamprocystis sp. TaxID=543132 RepID=UPI0025D99D92|nr:hypothetical protein [uncultured Lamprocystis sp.]